MGPSAERGGGLQLIRVFAVCVFYVQSLVGENPCHDLLPGTFDWHKLRNSDPYPNGEFGEVRAVDCCVRSVNSSASLGALRSFLGSSRSCMHALGCSLVFLHVMLWHSTNSARLQTSSDSTGRRSSA